MELIEVTADADNEDDTDDEYGDAGKLGIIACGS
jgi:hypothetical protein